MYIETSLKLLSEKFASVAKSPYFNSAIEKYADWFVKVIEHAIHPSASYEIEELRRLLQKLRVCYRYLQGSSMNETPYEIEYCMHSVLKEWFSKDNNFGIATALDSSFHIRIFEKAQHLDSNLISGLLDNLDVKGPEETLILMELPNWFNHTPLYCIPLYHELGHFVDTKNQISKLVSMNNPDLFNYYGDEDIRFKHIQEHFADIFASCYVGDALNRMLLSETLDEFLSIPTHKHPAIKTRTEFVNDFLENPDDNKFKAYQDVLASKNLPKLKQRFETPEIDNEFNDMRPYKIEKENVKELHGIFLAGWEYLEKMNAGHCPEWAVELSVFERMRIINNLLEKSIRNHSINKLWNGE